MKICRQITLPRAVAAGAAITFGLLTSCTQPDKATPADPAPPPTAVVPPPGAGMHKEIGRLEAVWHLRAALNVAALSCGRDQQLVSNYNGMLKRHKGKLDAAYAAETDSARTSHGAGYQRALDTHMTQLYNYFAWPPAQTGFCHEAKAVAGEAATVPAADFEDFAVLALARLDRTFTEPAPAAIHVASAAPRAAAAPEKGRKSSQWRIQVGAFTGRKAAEAAWAKVQQRSSALAAFKPHYEQVPHRPQLVRLQLGAGSDRESALRLCALASAAGFECLPVS